MQFLPPAKCKYDFHPKFNKILSPNPLIPDPMIESWLFFGSPMPMMIIFTIYLSSVIIGSNVMKNRKPLKLQTLIRIYNLIQIAGCTYFSYIAHFKFGYNSITSTWRCETNDMYIDTYDDIVQVFSLSWMFFWLRLIELFETIFFILRKKQQQVSVLHVYHHISTLVFLYLGSRYSAGRISNLSLKPTKKSFYSHIRGHGHVLCRHQQRRPHIDVHLLFPKFLQSFADMAAKIKACDDNNTNNSTHSYFWTVCC